ncbi:MAG TPA: tetratricopeptide repeat protein [Desulfobacteraceae bacterium]|nr:tetratricopeptide repeat protein [Desulfobacteraceae bacterium]
MKHMILITLMILAGCSILAAQNAAAFYNEGVTLLKEGQYQEAAEQFKRASIEDSTHLEARLGLAKAYFKLSQWENAEIALKEAHDLSPDNPVILDMLAKVKYMLKKYKESALLLEQLSAQDPQPEALSLLGNAYYRANMRSKAIKAFERSLDAGNKNTKDYRILASLYYKKYKQGKDKEILKRCFTILDQAIRVKPEPDTYYYKGRYSYFTKEMNIAREALAEAVSLDPGHSDALYYLAKTLFKLHEYDEALAYGLKLINKAQNSKYYALLGDICREKGDNSTASEYYKKGASYSDKTGQYCAQYYEYLNQPKQ